MTTLLAKRRFRVQVTDLTKPIESPRRLTHYEIEAPSIEEARRIARKRFNPPRAFVSDAGRQVPIDRARFRIRVWKA